MTASSFKVLIVGAGPAGLLLGLLLAKKNIPVTVLEQTSQLDDQPRATHYAPPSMRVLNAVGVGDEIRANGFMPNSLAFRRFDGSALTLLDHDQQGELDRMTVLPLNELCQLLKDHGEKTKSIKYVFKHRVVRIGQDESKAWVDALDLDANKETRFEADYIVGCDGANSIIRRSLFGDWEFPGKTWEEQIVATNTYYDFTKFGFSDANFIIDPKHWYMAARITTDGLWRVTYGVPSGQTREELIAGQPAKFEEMLPGNPKPDQYKLKNISPYKIHQRLAEKMRVGRFLLVADAAHLCNPFGGLGLTGGIVDAQGLYECLLGIYQKKADPSILDIYNDVRRKKWLEMIDPISSANLLRMFQDPDKVLETDEFVKLCKKAETDPQLALKLLESAHALSYDFTQHYTS